MSECWWRRLRIAFVRHAESENNVHEAVSWAAYVRERKSDPSLSERGFAQAEALGNWFAKRENSHFLLGVSPVDEIWISPTRRTLLTALPLKRALPEVSAKVKLNLFEAGGIFDANSDYTAFDARGGMTRTEMSEEFGDYELPEGLSEDGWYRGTGKETDDECRDRAKRFAKDLVDKAATINGQNQTIIVVAHYDFICAVLDAFIRPDTKGEFHRWHNYNTAITVIDIEPKEQPEDGDSSAAEATHDVVFVAQNAIPHILATGNPDLVSGFAIF